MPTNASVASNFHANGIIKNGDRLFTYTEYDGTGNVSLLTDVGVIRMPNGKYALTSVQTNPSTYPAIMFKGGDTFLVGIINKSGVATTATAPGTDVVLKTILPLVMTAAELSANNTPEGSAPGTNATFTDTSLEAYTVGSQTGYVRDKNAVVAVPGPINNAGLTANDPNKPKDFEYYAIRVGIGVVVVVGGIWLYNKFVANKVGKSAKSFFTR